MRREQRVSSRTWLVLPEMTHFPVSVSEDSRKARIIAMNWGGGCLPLPATLIILPLEDAGLWDICQELTEAKRAHGDCQPPLCLQLRVHGGSWLLSAVWDGGSCHRID